MAEKTKYVHVPMYKVSAETKNRGKLLTATRKVRWGFGYASYDALKRRCKGEECRGEEHEIEFSSAVQSIKVKKIRLVHNGNVIFDASVPRGDSGISESSNTSPSWQKEFRIKGKNHAAKVVVFGTRVELSFGGLPYEELPEINEIERNILSLYVAVPRSMDSDSKVMSVESSTTGGRRSSAGTPSKKERKSRRSLEDSTEGLGKSESHLDCIREKASSSRQRAEHEVVGRRHTATSARQYSKSREKRKSAISMSSSSERSDVTEPPETYSSPAISKPTSTKTEAQGIRPQAEDTGREGGPRKESMARTRTKRRSERRSYSVPKTREDTVKVESHGKSKRQEEASATSTHANSAPTRRDRSASPSKTRRGAQARSKHVEDPDDYDESSFSGRSNSSSTASSVESTESSLLSLDLLANTEKLANYLQSHLTKNDEQDYGRNAGDAVAAAAAAAVTAIAPMQLPYNEDDDATSVDISLTPSMAELHMDTWFDVNRHLAPRDPYPGLMGGYSPYVSHDLPVMFVGDKETKIVMDASLSAVSPTGVEEMSRASTLKTASTSRESKKTMSSRGSSRKDDQRGRKYGDRQVSQRSIIPSDFK